MDTSTTNTNSEFMSHKEIIDFVLSQYNLTIKKLESIKFKDTDKQRAVYKVITNKGPKCLKKVYYDKDTLLFIYSTIEWLNMKGIKCPRLLPSREGVRYVEYNEHIFILTDWIDGRKCCYDNIDDVLIAAKNLANLHKSSYGFVPIRNSTLRVSCTDYYNSYNKHLCQIQSTLKKASKCNDYFSNKFIENYEVNLNKARDSVNILSTIDFTDQFGDNVSTFSICHLDYVNKNLIFSNNGLYIIDFDNTKIDYPVHDIVYFVKRILKRKTTSWNFDIFEKAMDQYESVRTLSHKEHLFILAALNFPHKYWKISRDYYKLGSNKEFYEKQIDSLVSQQNDHDIFCRKYKEYINNRFK
ncbi:MAG: CotS family spore coat protein [Clostridium sp.]|uniref:CotS family spore coat protein n=1 Tax=Clostridium sp. TaxID=1506 RepID=UPI002FC5E8F0